MRFAEGGEDRQAPVLSIVVVPLGGRSDLLECLSALRRQQDPPAFEILVPHDETVLDAPTLRDSFPEARFLPLAGRRTYAELRAAGVEAAHGAIIALTEDHCRPDPGWAREIARAHEAPHAAIGGAVEKRAPAGVVSWAFYLSDYGRYMPPVPEGASSWMTDCNSSYKRAALAPIRSAWTPEFHETTVNWTLREKGETLVLSPRIVVEIARSLSLPDALRDRFAFGRLFACTRVAAVPAWKRFAYAASFWLVPVVRTSRAAANVVRKRRHFGPFLRALPVILLLDAVWACGELVGYVTGTPGRALDARTPA